MSDAPTPAQSLLAAKLSELWLASRSTILQRLADLRSAHEDLIADPDNEDARHRGRDVAHKLAGVLGTFGLPQGSKIASAIETTLTDAVPLTPADVATLGAHISELDAVVASKK